MNNQILDAIYKKIEDVLSICFLKLEDKRRHALLATGSKNEWKTVHKLCVERNKNIKWTKISISQDIYTSHNNCTFH